MTKLNSLKEQARNAAAIRGHRLGRFYSLTNSLAAAYCFHCYKQVVVNSKPKPNEIDIGGEVVALGCISEKEVEG